MPSVLECHPKVQLICIGPVIDLYGKFAALKLARMMEKYPGRVFSKPEFTTLPEYIFSGAEFALIPSRDEPFGLVAVEFGRKGALGVGARVGGLGQMPGWWYTVESTTSAHLIKQFKGAIESAISSSREVRAIMRARSAKQRFPVQQWKEDLGILQSNAIAINQRENSKRKSRWSYSSRLATQTAIPELLLPDCPSTWPFVPSAQRVLALGESTPTSSFCLSRNSTPEPHVLHQKLSMGLRNGPGHGNRATADVPSGRSSPGFHLPEEDSSNEEASDCEDEHILSEEEMETSRRNIFEEQVLAPAVGDSLESLRTKDSPLATSVKDCRRSDPCFLELPSASLDHRTASRPISVLSLDSVIGDKKDFKLQQIDPDFTDSTREFYNIFDARLTMLNGRNSETTLCIEEYLIKSEKAWYNRLRDARLGRTPIVSAVPSPNLSRSPSFIDDNSTEKDEFLLGANYQPPKGLKK
jgi:alpha-1,3-glucan synthase